MMTRSCSISQRAFLWLASSQIQRTRLLLCLRPSVCVMNEEQFIQNRLNLNIKVLQKATSEQPFAGDLSSIAQDEAC